MSTIETTIHPTQKTVRSQSQRRHTFATTANDSPLRIRRFSSGARVVVVQVERECACGSNRSSGMTKPIQFVGTHILCAIVCGFCLHCSLHNLALFLFHISCTGFWVYRMRFLIQSLRMELSIKMRLRNPCSFPMIGWDWDFIRFIFDIQPIPFAAILYPNGWRNERRSKMNEN